MTHQRPGSSRMDVASAVRNQVLSTPLLQPFLSSSLSTLGSPKAVYSALRRLVSSGKIERVGRGIYVRPELHNQFGWIGASTLDVVQVVVRSKNNEFQVHGAEAVRKFGLSTQMQVKPVYYSTGRSQKIQIYGHTVRLVHVPKYCVQHTDSAAGLAIAALYYLRHDALTLDNISTILKQLTPLDRQKLRESPMPIWMHQAIAGALAASIE